jgi:hypothetical protein
MSAGNGMTGMTPLERRLRDGLSARAAELDAAPEAWQENQRRVAASGAERRPRRAVLLLAGAAAAAGFGVAVIVTGGDANRVTAPAGPDVLAEPCDHGQQPTTVFTGTVDGAPLRTELFLDGPATAQDTSLCVRLGPSSPDASWSTGGGTLRREGADDSEVAFDFLTGGERGVQGGAGVREVSGAVDERVATVVVVLADGSTRELPLVPLEDSGYQGFGIVTDGETYPVQLRAAASGGAPIQDVDLGEEFGPNWAAPEDPVAAPSADSTDSPPEEELSVAEPRGNVCPDDSADEPEGARVQVDGPDGLPREVLLSVGADQLYLRVSDSTGSSSTSCVSAGGRALASTGGLLAGAVDAQAQRVEVDIEGTTYDATLHDAVDGSVRVFTLALPGDAQADLSDAEVRAYSADGSPLPLPLSR